MTFTSAAHEANNKALDELRRFPVGLVVLLGLLIAGSGFWFASRLGMTPSAVCNGEAMSPGDFCERRSRRSGRYQVSYDQVLEMSQEDILWPKAAAAMIGIAALITLVMVVLRWRSDAALAAQLGTPPGLLGAGASTTGILTGVLALAVVFPALIGTTLVVKLAGVDDGSPTTLSWILLGLIAALVALLVWAGRPRGVSLFQVVEEGVIAVTGSRRHDVGWVDAQYFVPTGDSGSTAGFSWRGRSGSPLDVEDGELFAQVRSHVNAALWPVAQQRVASGEPLDFAELTLSGGALERGGKQIPLAELRYLQAVRKENLVTYQLAGAGRTIDVPAGSLANLDVLVGLLRERTSASVLGSSG